MTRTMYDSITIANLPGNASMVAGYVDGRWPTFAALERAFPNAVRVSIAVFATSTAHVLDVEKGDATPMQSVDWVVRMRALGRDPTVYCSTSAWPAVKACFAARSVSLPHWWRADYNGRAVLEMGEIAHQYVDIGPYDISTVADCWPGVDPPTQPEEYDLLTTYLAQGSDELGIWIVEAGKARHLASMNDVNAYRAAGAPLLHLSDQCIKDKAS